MRMILTMTVLTVFISLLFSTNIWTCPETADLPPDIEKTWLATCEAMKSSRQSLIKRQRRVGIQSRIQLPYKIIHISYNYIITSIFVIQIESAVASPEFRSVVAFFQVRAAAVRGWVGWEPKLWPNHWPWLRFRLIGGTDSIYRAYFLGLRKWISPQFIWPEIWY